MSTLPTHTLNLRPEDAPVWEMHTVGYAHSGVECDHCGKAIEVGEPAIYAEPPTDSDTTDDGLYLESQVYHLRCAMARAAQLSAAVDAFMDQFLAAAKMRPDGQIVARAMGESGGAALMTAPQND